MSKSAKLSVSELLRIACFYAERDREEYLAAWEHCKDEEAERIKRETRDFLDQLRDYRLKRWGRTKGERLLENAKLVSLKSLPEGQFGGEPCL